MEFEWVYLLVVAFAAACSKGNPPAIMDAPAGPAPVQFAPQVRYATASNPNSVEIADLDHDGKPDLAVASFYGIDAFHNNGDGAFAQEWESPLLSNASIWDVHAGDLNGDGALDLISGPGFVVNNGTGTFGAWKGYPAGGQAYREALVDLSGDGSLDVATIGFSSGVGVLFGGGNATFTSSSVSYSTNGKGTSTIAPGDLNKDGKADLVVRLAGAPGTIGVLLGSGNGAFDGVVEYEVGLQGDVFSGLAVGDLDGDGALDLAVTGGDGAGSNGIGVLMGAGDGTFHPPTIYPVPNCAGVAIGDLNGDGKPDLAVSQPGAWNVGVFLNHGDGTFADEVTFVTLAGPLGIAIADLNGDMRPDLVTANQTNDSISVLLQVP